MARKNNTYKQASEKAKAGNKWPHSSYLFTNDRTNDDAFDKLLKFGKDFPSTKVFLIKQLDVVQLKAEADRGGISISKENKKLEYKDSLDKKEKSLFWKTLNDMHTMAEIKKTVLITFTLNGRVPFYL